MRMPISSRIIYVLTSIVMALGSHLADWNDSHLFNPHWQPHAIFHDAMTLSLSILLGLMTILFAWRKTGERVTAVIAASSFEGVFWLSFFTAALYPNTSFHSHPEEPPFYPAGVAPQLYISFAMLALIALASWLASAPVRVGSVSTRNLDPHGRISGAPTADWPGRPERCDSGRIEGV